MYISNDVRFYNKTFSRRERDIDEYNAVVISEHFDLLSPGQNKTFITLSISALDVIYKQKRESGNGSISCMLW